jgi:formylmethanofuran dehydrogenase subunit E
MDEFTKTLKQKKPAEDESTGDPRKKEKIMKMHAEGDEINYTRCELCGERFSSKDLQEYNDLYYCANCIEKAKQPEE